MNQLFPLWPSALFIGQVELFFVFVFENIKDPRRYRDGFFIQNLFDKNLEFSLAEVFLKRISAGEYTVFKTRRPTFDIT